MKILFKLFFILALVSIAHAEDIAIEKDGNYIMPEVFPILEGATYEISGDFIFENNSDGMESYIQIGLVPYGENKEPLQKKNDFPLPFEDVSSGFIPIDTLIFEKRSSYKYTKTVKLGGCELKEVSFVIGASLSAGAKLEAKNFRMVQLKNDPDSDNSASARLSKNKAFSKNPNSSYLNEASDKEQSEDILSGDKKAAEEEKYTLKASRRIIYVNSDLGSDKFEGLKKRRGQVDGPKKTLKSALKNLHGEEEVVLQNAESSYEISKIGTKGNGKLVIRAEGEAILKAKK